MANHLCQAEVTADRNCGSHHVSGLPHVGTDSRFATLWRNVQQLTDLVPWCIPQVSDMLCRAVFLSGLYLPSLHFKPHFTSLQITHFKRKLRLLLLFFCNVHFPVAEISVSSYVFHIQFSSLSFPSVLLTTIISWMNLYNSCGQNCSREKWSGLYNIPPAEMPRSWWT